VPRVPTQARATWHTGLFRLVLCLVISCVHTARCGCRVTHLSHSSDSSLTMKDRTLMVSLWLTETASCDYLWNDCVAMLFVA